MAGKLGARTLRYFILTLVPFSGITLFFSKSYFVVGSLDAAMAGKLGARTLLYYISTTALAVTEGFIFVYAVRPGANSNARSVVNATAKVCSLHLFAYCEHSVC